MITRTIGKLHFSDLEPGRFEVLAMQIIYRMRRWEQLNHYGAAGSDDGVDIDAEELLENGKRDVHHFQCKRYDKLTKSQLEKIVKDYIEKNIALADYYYVVCGCNPSKVAIEGFNHACEKSGIKHYAIWSASFLEALLYSDYHDILFSFFGINLSSNRNNRITAIRRNIALKKRMKKDFLKDNLDIKEIDAVRRKGEYWRKFKHSEVLIRSIYDKNYPDNPVEMPGYFKAEVYNWYHNGLEVRAAPYGVKAKVKVYSNGYADDSEISKTYEVEEWNLEVFGCIPFENIIEYDCDGDEYNAYPHLFCDYPSGSTPFEDIRYRTHDGYEVDKDDIIEFL